MINLKNELPVAVHIASGGDARVRTGGEAVRLSGITSGSFQLMEGTRYRMQFAARSTGGIAVLVGYTSPVTLATASRMAFDMNEVYDDVPQGAVVYFSLVNPDDLTPASGGANDVLFVSYYG